MDTLLDSCPRLRILATSREALGVEGEVRWLVPPLSVPEPQGTPSSEELEGYESVRLFVERARERDPSFSLSPQNALAVAEICRRLEGIPLAIELAAARVGTLSVEQISQRLEDSLRLLTRGSRTAVPRQRTLKGTLDWSYELLSERREGALRAALGVRGRMDPGGRGGGGLQEAASRRAKSWICSPGWWRSLWWWPRATGRRVRYRMLEPVRQYAREKLEESGRPRRYGVRHADFFLALAEEAEPRLRGPEDMEWLERLETEHDNMRAALSWALERGEVELAYGWRELCGGSGKRTGTTAKGGGGWRKRWPRTMERLRRQGQGPGGAEAGWRTLWRPRIEAVISCPRRPRAE